MGGCGVKLDQVEVGKTYSYHPPQDEGENLHFPAQVVRKAKRVTIRTNASERLLAVSPKRLTDQLDLWAAA